MPPDPYSPSDAFVINIPFGTSGNLDAALHLIEQACYQGESEMRGIVAALYEHPYTLEYIVSCTSRLPVCPFVILTRIILPCSAGEGCIQEALQVDGCQVSHIQNANRDGKHERAVRSKIFAFAAICRAVAGCRCIPPTRAPQERGTLVQRFKRTREEFQNGPL